MGLKTLLVDDDFLVRSYLKTLDSWEKAGFEIVQDVRDGEEALKVLKNEAVDVIITDISMPLMDGIELIRQIALNKLEVYIIVLSCHDDFEYVKEAMKLGADEYVLKNTLDEHTLLELLENSKKQIANQCSIKGEDEHKKKLIKMGSHSLKYLYFNALISGRLSIEEREQKRREAGITASFSNSAVINLFMDDWNEQSSQWTPVEAEQYSHYFLDALDEEIERVLGKESDDAEVIYLGAGIFTCFLDLSGMHRSSMMQQRLTTAAGACFQCAKREPFGFGIGVSNVCMGEDGIRQAYQQAREMLKLRFYDDSDILYFDCNKEITSQMPQSAQELLDMSGTYVSKRQREEFFRAYEKVMEDCRKAYVDSRLILHWLKELDKELNIQHSLEDYAKVKKVEHLILRREYYEKELFGEKKRQIPDGVSNVVRQTLTFINGHYKKQIGLSDAAEAVGVNPAYLSYLFKQEMEIGFVNYLLECRMDYAKELLHNTNLKVKEVAAESGFNNYHYFTKTFKKINGCSPVDYRNSSQSHSVR